MTITLNFTTIFAWLGGIVCAAFCLWLLYWLICWIVGMGEFLGIWQNIAWAFQDLKAWVKKKYRGRS